MSEEKPLNLDEIGWMLRNRKSVTKDGTVYTYAELLRQLLEALDDLNNQHAAYEARKQLQESAEGHFRVASEVVSGLRVELKALRRVLELNWTLGQYTWTLDRWHHWDEDYFTHNGIDPPNFKCSKPKGHVDDHG